MTAVRSLLPMGKLRSGIRIASLWALATVSPGSSPARAQLPGASAAVDGAGNSYTVLARGAVAVGMNPAGLGLRGNPAWSLVIPGVRLSGGMDPISLRDLGRYSGRTVPREARLDWLERIRTERGQHGTGSGDVTAMAFSRGRWGVQLATVAGAAADLNPDAAELLLFGNAGLTGEARELILDGARVDAFLLSTIGLSAGVPLSQGSRGTFAVGWTISFSMGHALLVGRDAGSLARGEPVELDLRLPLIQPDSDAGIGAGTGLGIDLAAAWQRDPWSIGIVLENLANGFRWNAHDLIFRPGEAFFDANDLQADFQELPLREAPLTLRREVKELTFKPRLKLAAGYEVTSRLTVTGELQRRLEGGGLPLGPRTHAGIAAEYRILPLTLRGGGAHITDGRILAAGLGVRLGSVDVAGAVLLEREGTLDTISWALSLALGPR